MSMTGHVRVELDMPFPVAGVGFRVQMGPGDATEGMTLLIGLRALEEGKTARCTLESSQPSGHFHPRYTVLQMLQTLQELCEMLNDKFAGYPASIHS